MGLKVIGIVKELRKASAIEKRWKQKLVNEIYALYKPFLRASGYSKNLTCPTNKNKNSKKRESFTIKEKGREEVEVIASWENKAICDAAIGGGATVMPLMDYSIPELIKIYTVTENIVTNNHRTLILK